MKFSTIIWHTVFPNIEGISPIWLYIFIISQYCPTVKQILPDWLSLPNNLGGSYAYAFGHIMFVCYIIYNVIYFVGKVVPINLSSLEEVPGCVGGESKRIRRNNHCWGWTT